MITESCKVIELFAPASRTASANGTGVDLAGYNGDNAMVTLHIGAVSGTTPTLDVKIQDSADNSTFADIATPVAFSQKTAAGIYRINYPVTANRRYVRAVATIAGTTPNFTFGVSIAVEDSVYPVTAQG